jgi:lipopolysaccharide/colanic/teichoic acid biosynthesis glycosyltransferase
MSFVGPLPLLLIDQPTVLMIRPGWAQTNDGRRIPPEEKEVLDERPIQNASFWLDIRVILGTIGIVWFGDGFGAIEIARSGRREK